MLKTQTFIFNKLLTKLSIEDWFYVVKRTHRIDWNARWQQTRHAKLVDSNPTPVIFLWNVCSQNSGNYWVYCTALNTHQCKGKKQIVIDWRLFQLLMLTYYVQCSYEPIPRCINLVRLPQKFPIIFYVTSEPERKLVTLYK